MTKALAADELRRKQGVGAPVGTVDEKHGHKYAGVVPPPLNRKFMTQKLSVHQMNGLKEIRYHRRQQLCADGSVHDVNTAISYLRENIVGFFVAAPLNRGHGTQVKDDATKATAISGDIASATPSKENGNVST